MKNGIEQRLREIVKISTQKAAIQEWKEAAEKQQIPLYNYRYDHIEEVVKLARVIASETEANLDVVTLAAWLHDLAKPGVGGISAQQHGIVSAEMAKEILIVEKVDKEVIDQVMDIIEKHVGLTIKEPLKPIEAQILWEADKIMKLGMIGFIQGLLNGVRLFPGRDMTEIAESLNEFIPLATDITNCMVTQKGKKLAQERLEKFKTLVQYLNSELEIKNEE